MTIHCSRLYFHGKNNNLLRIISHEIIFDNDDYEKSTKNVD